MHFNGLHPGIISTHRLHVIFKGLVSKSNTYVDWQFVQSERLVHVVQFGWISVGWQNTHLPSDNNMAFITHSVQ